MPNPILHRSTKTPERNDVCAAVLLWLFLRQENTPIHLSIEQEWSMIQRVLIKSHTIGYELLIEASQHSSDPDLDGPPPWENIGNELRVGHLFF